MNSQPRVKIKGCSSKFYLYQGFGSFVMMEMEMFQNGGYNADEMGFGKVRKLQLRSDINGYTIFIDIRDVGLHRSQPRSVEVTPGPLQTHGNINAGTNTCDKELQKRVKQRTLAVLPTTHWESNAHALIKSPTRCLQLSNGINVLFIPPAVIVA